MKRAPKKHCSGGFTLIELLVIVSIFVVITALGFSVLRLFQGESDISSTSESIESVLRLAQSKTVASEDKSRYGVFFNDTVNPHRYILFKGESYASRVPAFDKVSVLPNSVEMFGINFNGAKEVVFDRLSGTASQPGELSLRLLSDPARIETIYVENSGKITSQSSSIASDANRIKDSRHVHLLYAGRIINTSTEKLRLTFSATSTEIVISSNMKAGQIYWEGEVVDGGEIQKLKIHTHKLNDASLETEFCIHRDKRFNTKPLTIDIDASPDPDLGTLIQYDANGIITQGTSLYVQALPPNLQ